MTEPIDPTRRSLLGGLAAGLSLAPLAIAPAHAAPGSARLTPLSESDPAAKAVHYVTDARRATGAQSGAACANCSIYSMASATDGTCTLFPGKLVKAAGWCSSWSGL